MELVPYVRRSDWPVNTELRAELDRAIDDRGAGQRLAVPSLDELSDGERRAVRVIVADGPAATQIESLPALEWVQSTWAGVEQLLDTVPAAIPVARMIDPQLAHTMSEAVLAWTLYLHRDMPRYAQQQRDASWVMHRLTPTARRRVGVLGLGELGAHAAHRLASQGFDVAGWARSPKSIDGVDTFVGDDGFRALLERSDIVVNLLPHTPATEDLLDAEAFAAMPARASLINFGRGTAVVDADLIAALDTEHLDHAVLDVYRVEPLPRDHPFWTHPKITALPHISGPTMPDTAADIAVDNVLRWLDDGSLPLRALVDRQANY